MAEQKTREHLLAAAESFARAAVNDNPGTDQERRMAFAQASKTALEAAALADDVGPGEIAQVLDQIRDELAAAGYDRGVADLEPIDVLRGLLAAMRDWQDLAQKIDGMGAANGILMSTMAGLEQKFNAAGTMTSTRLAEQIRAAIDEALKHYTPPAENEDEDPNGEEQTA